MTFQQLKEYLSRPPIMFSPEVDNVLFAYLEIASHAVSFVLIREDSGVQRPVYYVSKSLHEAEVRYLSLEKAILAVVHATRKLPHYFQAHTVAVDVAIGVVKLVGLCCVPILVCLIFVFV